MFTLRIHTNGEFKRLFGRRVWVGGLVRFVDWCHKDEIDMQLLGEICEGLGVGGRRKTAEALEKTIVCGGSEVNEMRGK